MTQLDALLVMNIHEKPEFLRWQLKQNIKEKLIYCDYRVILN